MSLEKTIEANTLAIEALTKVWAALTEQAATMTAANLAEATAGGTPVATVAPSVVANAKTETVAKVKAEPKAKKAEPEVVAKADELTYADISPLIVAIAKEKGREEAIALLTKFGAKLGSDIKPEQYASFKAQAEAILNPKLEESLV